MISVKEVKIFLEKENINFSDEQLRIIIEFLTELGEIEYENFTTKSTK